ncbi:60S ribosomal protein L39-like protein [Tupaia chinensis]|uniref:Large ribosomal subunit protein eL39 n=1 Tax=Tupaia chinensis TaxID=246437 RepID=L9L7P6_TUPCH|nr:60S ribosomal protein L39-like protein [Tupaia chinensis]
MGKELLTSSPCRCPSGVLLRYAGNQLGRLTYRCRVPIPRVSVVHLGPRFFAVTFRIKRFLTKKRKQNRLIRQWIQMKSDSKIRYNAKRGPWRRITLAL